MKKKAKIVLVAENQENREYYLGLLAKYKNISVATYSTLLEFRKNCTAKTYSGLIMDIRTLIKSTDTDKDFYTSLYQGFPILQIDRSHDHSPVNCFIEGEKSTETKGMLLLDHFITKICLHKNARGVRLQPRRTQFCNTLLAFTEKGIHFRTNLWNISEGGCFVISTAQGEKGDLIWLTVTELKDKTPICSQVKWHMPWGTTAKKLPGFGVSFLELTNQQKKAIKELSIAS